MQNGKLKKILAVSLSAAMLVSAVAVGSVYADESDSSENKVSLSIAGEDSTEEEESVAEEETESETQTETQTESETETETQTESETETEAKVNYDELETTAGGDSDIQAVDISDIVKNVMPSIVAITTKSVQEVESYLYGTQQYEEEGAGSGFIIAQNEEELLIATNKHVVEDSDELTVCFSVDSEDPDKLVVPAVVKGTDSNTDLAVVAVSLSDIDEDVYNQLKIATLGSSDDLEVGEPAIVIGNALGIGQTVTTGIISALNRDITTEAGTFTEIQTDAAINLGCSGGAILNSDGEVVGVVSAKATGDYAESMGYGIPIDTAIPVLEQLINRETRSEVENHGYLGITVVPVSDEAKEMYNMPAGAFVYEVTEGGPADEAGIKTGDIITKFDGVSIDSSETLVETISYYEIGETVDVEVETAQDGSYVSKTVSVTLGEGPEEETTDESESSDSSSQNETDSSDGSSDSGSTTPNDSGSSDGSSDFYGYYGSQGDLFNQFFGNGGSNGYGSDNGSSSDGSDSSNSGSLQF